MLSVRPRSARLRRACLQTSSLAALALALFLCPVALSGQAVRAADSAPESELQIDITRIGLGKEVVITKGRKEWFMRVEVTPENSVVVRQEKEGERYLLDESEMHDRAMTPAEVDAAITDFVNSVKTRQKAQ
ncbi:MAG: hypothetical protein H8K05_18915 [Nitrospira sp.]|nr:hypothetical protein [Nitrospira sp.]MCS6319795.1 hypothetical protein [Nitrospira sp.]